MTKQELKIQIATGALDIKDMALSICFDQIAKNVNGTSQLHILKELDREALIFLKQYVLKLHEITQRTIKGPCWTAYFEFADLIDNDYLFKGLSDGQRN